MVHRAAAFSQIKHGTQRTGDIRFRPLYGCIHIESFRQIRSNSAGQGASCSVGIRIVNALSVEPAVASVSVEQIIGVI